MGLRGGEFLLRTTTRFFGRKEEVVRLASMLSTPRTRLVTLIGPGGIGKTRLALEVAAELVERPGADTVAAAVFVPLENVAEPAGIVDAVLRRLGGVAVPGRQPMDQIAEALSARTPTLLILDNFEHLVDGGALVARDLLARTPARLLVTSRQKLCLEGEHTFYLAPLPTTAGADTLDALLANPSISLFVDRAQSALPDFQLTDRNAAVVGQLCDRLEGIPLALELAAARVPVLSVGRIVEQVSTNRLDFLASRQRGISERHHTLRATLDWSYSLLPEEAKQFLARASVFRGGWTIDAAAAVCGVSETEALDLLTSLRDSSLIGVVDTEDGLRFTVLGTIREYAVEQLERSGFRETACRAHAAFFVDLAEESGRTFLGPEGLQAVRRVGREQENMRAALAWVEANRDDPLHGRVGAAIMRAWIGVDWVQLGQWLSGVRQMGPSDSAGAESGGMVEPMANLLLPMGGHIDSSGDPDVTMAHLRQLADLHEQQRETVRSAWTLIYLSMYAISRSLPEARRNLEKAATMMREAGTAVGIGCALTELSLVLWDQGEFGRALELSAEAFEVLAGHRETTTFGRALLVEAQHALDIGDLPRGRELYEQNMALRHRIEDTPGTGVASLTLVLAALSEQNFDAAVRCGQEALAVLEEAGWNKGGLIARTLGYLARARLGKGQLREAEKLARQSLTRFRGMRDRYGYLLCMHLLADLAVHRAETARAARLLGACRTMRVTLGLRECDAEHPTDSGIALFANEQEQIGQLRERLAAAFGEAQFAGEQQFGEKLTEEEAIALALEETPHQA